ncbi:Pls/PosA family non-ribosomal peptide synthetase [Amycolatopsis sp. NPDC059027]|uniref:Pls/PosA family non-ribosomal peptide synthetase n=1 Tax=Amycolatopsis sp. NPDC059027 TaxID=3346709 RepID=UPI00366A577D
MSPREAPVGLLADEGRVLTCGGFDQEIRWHSGERLEQLFEQRCDLLPAGTLAVDAGDVRLTFAELDERANRLGRHLLAQGVLAGDRIGLLFDQPVQTYVAMLAVLKINAGYVPLDTAFPDDRLAYIARDAGVRMVLTLSALRDRFERGSVDLVCVDEDEPQLAARPGGRLSRAEKGEPADELCYIIYTSGSTGRPKGVPIDHGSICNFVRVASEVYGIESGDRMYQGMTIAFDFSVEEIWVPLLSGATLVPKPSGASLIGYDLYEFLRDNDITAMCCVPTLLATLDEDLPALRFLLVSGEACPEDLIARWHRPGRRFLNVYGPTEATVTATWAVVRPDQPVTIGVPLPTYSVVILDPDEPRALAAGELGEIGIAGIGLATGYLNRPDLTERAFVPDFLGIERNPSGRIYRTGDLGRITADGEIEYHGRTDTQVKIRGYRIELTEIESVLLRVPGIAQAVVDTYEPEPGTVELVAYYSLRRDASTVDTEEIRRLLRERLPAYMVPAYFEQLDLIPMTPSDKADRKNLPAPTGRRTVAAPDDHVAPATETERQLAQAFAEVLRLDEVSVTGHFFDDYSANSLLLARFCTRVRDIDGLAPPSMKDVYLHPTVRSLADTLSAAPPVTPAVQATATAEPYRAGTVRYVLCGLFQLLVFLAYAAAAGVVLERGFDWITAAPGLVETYLRIVGFGLAGFAFMVIVPILAKWLLVGRWKPGEITVWGPGYLRFWTVRTLTRFNPLVMFAGSPLYSFYLRALGAKIGKGAVILSHNPPVCTDLLTVGAGAVIRKDTFFTGYRVEGGRIRTGRVSIGDDAFVGEHSILDIDTVIGDDAQLGHASSLHSGHAVPDGESWHGSPAQPSTVDYRALATGRTGAFRRFLFCAGQLLTVLLFTIPLLLAGTDLVVQVVYPAGRPDFGSWAFWSRQLAGSAALYFGGLLASLVLVLTVPRLLTLFLKPDRVYPLYGLRYSFQRTIARLTNVRTLTYLFGDSSYIVHYLRALGYGLSKVEQTGSNFGVEVKHETPFLSTVGAGTMVSDGLSFMNADFSGSSFRLRRTAVAPKAFLGNNIVYPPDSRVGENCLLATKVLVPLDGPVRENTGLLGSPAFEIPRSVRRDGDFDHLKTGDTLRRGLAAKLRHNTVTLLCYLLVQWLNFLGVVLIGVVTGSLHSRFGALATGAEIVLTLFFSVSFLVLAERAISGFRSLRPRFCSIYDRRFWRHERFWKLSAGRYLALFNGTPFKNTLWRLLGVRIGRRVFDDGCAIPEKSLLTIGDDCSLNAGSVIQCHSLEDGTFKSDHIVLGAGCTVGTGAFVHYGVSMGDGTVIDADAFLMKGSEPPPGSRWRGNPATELATETETTALVRSPR